ncbi:hypothetical protein [Sporosarcina sp. FA15]|uniref:hypothetical protein n=1 Tax=Sporosarcina sp. FA15 TaxID=3413031 RepID=UPI003F655BC2
MFDVEINKEANETNSFYAKNVVFTGALSVCIGTGLQKEVWCRSAERGNKRNKLCGLR